MHEEQMPDLVESLRINEAFVGLQTGAIHRLDMTNDRAEEAVLYRFIDGGIFHYRLYHINHNEAPVNSSKWTDYRHMWLVVQDGWKPVNLGN